MKKGETTLWPEDPDHHNFQKGRQDKMRTRQGAWISTIALRDWPNYPREKVGRLSLKGGGSFRKRERQQEYIEERLGGEERGRGETSGTTKEELQDLREG